MKKSIIFLFAIMSILISCKTTPDKTYPLGDNTNLVLIDAEEGGYYLYDPETKERSEYPMDTVYVGNHELIGYNEYRHVKSVYTLSGRPFICNIFYTFVCETPKGHFYLIYTGGDFKWYNASGISKGYYNEQYAFKIIDEAEKSRDKNNPFVLYIDEKYYPGN